MKALVASLSFLVLATVAPVFGTHWVKKKACMHPSLEPVNDKFECEGTCRDVNLCLKENKDVDVAAEKNFVIPLRCPGPAEIMCCMQGRKSHYPACSVDGTQPCPTNVSLERLSGAGSRGRWNFTMGDRWVAFSMPSVRSKGSETTKPHGIVFGGASARDVDLGDVTFRSLGIELPYAKLMKIIGMVEAPYTDEDSDGGEDEAEGAAAVSGERRSDLVQRSLTGLFLGGKEILRFGFAGLEAKGGFLAAFLAWLSTGPYQTYIDFYFTRMGVCASFVSSDMSSPFQAEVSVVRCSDWERKPGCVGTTDPKVSVVSARPHWDPSRSSVEGWKEIMSRPDLIGALLLSGRDKIIATSQIRVQASVLQNFVTRDRGGYSIAGYVTSEGAMGAFLLLANAAPQKALQRFNWWRSRVPDCKDWQLRRHLYAFSKDLIKTYETLRMTGISTRAAEHRLKIIATGAFDHNPNTFSFRNLITLAHREREHSEQRLKTCKAIIERQLRG